MQLLLALTFSEYSLLICVSTDEKYKIIERKCECHVSIFLTFAKNDLVYNNSSQGFVANFVRSFVPFVLQGNMQQITVLKRQEIHINRKLLSVS